MKKILLILVIALGIYGVASQPHYLDSAQLFFSSFTSEMSTSDKALKNAFEKHLSNIQLGGAGKVVKLLSDDNKGRRHQRFILELASGQTLLIAHNIDLAPRVNDLEIRDHVNFYGVYEWNAQGGVVHWTHHDPKGIHETGWLISGGKMYQ